MNDELVIVTGGAGFIGSNVVAELAADGANVVVSDWFAHDDAWRYLVPFLVHDIVQPDQLLTWLHTNRDRVAAIVHMGAISSTIEMDQQKIIHSNIRFTLDLWTHAAKYDTKFIYASSAATYGDGAVGFVDNDASAALARLRPLNPYGWSKHFVDRRIADDIANDRSAPTRWAGLKFFNVYGPNEGHKGSMRSVVHQLYPAAARGETVRLFKSDHPHYPDGGQLRDFVYVKDCSEVVSRVLRAPKVGGIYNVGTGVARTFSDLARAIFVALGLEPRIEYIAMPPHLSGKYQYFTEADTSRLTSAGFAPQFYTLEEGVADYIHTDLALRPLSELAPPH